MGRGLKNWRENVSRDNIACKTASNAGYTPQDNQADLGPISSRPTILGNVPIRGGTINRYGDIS